MTGRGIAAASLLFAAAAFAQSREGAPNSPLKGSGPASMPELTKGIVTGANNFIHSVLDMDKSAAFYRDALGLELRTAPGRAAGFPAPDPLNDALSNLTATRGAKF